MFVIAALDDLMTRFAPLTDEAEPVRSVRGLAYALAWHWQVTVPDSAEKRAAMERFAEAAELMAGASAASL